MIYPVLFERDHGNIRPLVSKQRLEAMFDGIIFILLWYVIYVLMSNLKQYLALYI
jgi:hypothetical protein